MAKRLKFTPALRPSSRPKQAALGPHPICHLLLSSPTRLRLRLSTFRRLKASQIMVSERKVPATSASTMTSLQKIKTRSHPLPAIPQPATNTAIQKREAPPSKAVAASLGWQVRRPLERRRAVLRVGHQHARDHARDGSRHLQAHESSLDSPLEAMDQICLQVQPSHKPLRSASDYLPLSNATLSLPESRRT